MILYQIYGIEPLRLFVREKVSASYSIKATPRRVGIGALSFYGIRCSKDIELPRFKNYTKKSVKTRVTT